MRMRAIECGDVVGGSIIITDNSTSYDIMGLEEDSSYTITVIATNVAGSSAVSDAVTAMTLEVQPLLLVMSY